MTVSPEWLIIYSAKSLYKRPVLILSHFRQITPEQSTLKVLLVPLVQWSMNVDYMVYVMKTKLKMHTLHRKLWAYSCHGLMGELECEVKTLKCCLS